MPSRASLLRTFVSDLAAASQIPGFRNPYHASHAAHNLFQFLSLHDPSSEAPLLVGEAPGYRGAALSGVPLTSLSVLLEWRDDPWGAFGHEGYRAPATAKPPHQREATATMVWRVLGEQLPSEPLPLTWNAVPFHPLGPSPDSNRPVRQREVRVGAQWIERSSSVCGLGPWRLADSFNGVASIGPDVRVRAPIRGGPETPDRHRSRGTHKRTRRMRTDIRAVDTPPPPLAFARFCVS